MPRRAAIPIMIVLLALTAACGGGKSHDTPTKPGAQRTQPSEEGGRNANTSTFALDVDTASYGYARRLIQEGRLPEPSNVRPEEFVNAFRQDYPEPDGNGFTIHVDGARMAEQTALVRVGLQTRKDETVTRRDANLTFVIDVSGSMAEAGRLDLVKSALHTLINELRPTDGVAIVAFSTSARMVAPMTRAVERDSLHQAIDRLSTEASTNLEDGVVMGYQEASRAFRQGATNRVILLSDGLANVGSTTHNPILDKIGEYADKGITLLGVGVGREYGDELMERLADKGNGLAHYVSTQQQATDIFVSKLPANLDLRARDAKAQVVFNPSAVESFRLVGYDNRALAAEDFRNDSVDGGEVGPGHTVTALYAVRLRASADGGQSLAEVTVRWQDPDTRRPSETAKRLAGADLVDDLWGRGSQRLQVTVVSAGFAQALQKSPYRDLPSLAELHEHASRLARSIEDPAVTELASLIDRARRIE